MNREKKTKLLHKRETTAVGKGLIGKRRKYFPAHQYQNFRTLNICNGAKYIYPKKQKKDSKKTYSTNYTGSRPEVFCKTGRNFKNLQQHSAGSGTGHRCFPVNFAKFVRTTIL